MKKILLHDVQYEIGGPNSVLNNITNSYLSQKFNFVRITQKGGCGYNPIKAIRFIWHYVKLINREHADAIYICGLQYVGFLMTLAAKLSNVKKIILSIHGSDWDTPDNTLRKRILMYIIEPLEIKWADCVFTVCKSAQKSINALRYAKKGTNRGVVYNTIPTFDECRNLGKLRSLLNISNNKIIVASVGRVVYTKGHQYIIEAIKKLNDKDFVFVIIGDGEYLKEYQKRCTQEIQEKRLFLLGKRNDVKELLEDADIFLFATLNENHSIALLEAVSAHCAIIATNVGGNPEIIHNNNSGIIISPCNSDMIVKSLKRLRDPALRELYSKNAFEYASTYFSTKNTLGKLQKIFEEQTR